MSNLTIVVDDEALKKARLRAMEEDSSLNAVLREFINAYARVSSRHKESMERILTLSESASSLSGEKRWTRDELYESK